MHSWFLLLKIFKFNFEEDLGGFVNNVIALYILASEGL